MLLTAGFSGLEDPGLDRGGIEFAHGIGTIDAVI
jgi:hypothetical protein